MTGIRLRAANTAVTTFVCVATSGYCFLIHGMTVMGCMASSLIGCPNLAEMALRRWAYVCLELSDSSGSCRITCKALSGESCSDTGLKVRPYVSVTKKYSRDVISGDTIVNFALRELGSAGIIKSKSDVAKMKAADIKLLAEYLQQRLDHDPQNDCISARRSCPRSILHPPNRLGAVTAKWAPFHTLDC
ncbi:hypothetical protein ABBQ32_006163 [Trebouxia sp. C0010 RCD-2024]